MTRREPVLVAALLMLALFSYGAYRLHHLDEDDDE
jgi:hypothetical protein